jgi:hypothetical protein
LFEQEAVADAARADGPKELAGAFELALLGKVELEGRGDGEGGLGSGVEEGLGGSDVGGVIGAGAGHGGLLVGFDDLRVAGLAGAGEGDQEW